MRVFWGIGVCLLLCWLSSCKPGVPSGVIDEDTMEDILFDYHLAQAAAEATIDSMEYRRYNYVQSVFDKHGITEADFDSSMVWYSQHADFLLNIYTRLEARYQDEQGKLTITEGGGKQMYANLSEHGDTANIWGSERFYILRSNPLDNKLDFVMEADTSFRKGDSFLWKFDIKFVYKEGAREAYCGLAVHYTDSTTVSSSRHISSNKGVEIKVNANRKKEIEKITGFVYLPSVASDTYRMLVLSNTMLIRFHREPAERVRSEVKTDTLVRDTLTADSLPVDWPVADSVRRGQRLSPRELRESQPVERKINVVKERKVYLPAQKQRRKEAR